jgi:tetratricopeptide (TPR) repeat protein
MMDVWVKTSKSPKASIGKAIELVKKAIALYATNSNAHGLLGFLYSMTNQHDKALAQAEKTVALNPNSAMAHFTVGKTLFFLPVDMKNPFRNTRRQYVLTLFHLIIICLV